MFYNTRHCVVFFRPKKFIRISRDDYFNAEDHHLSTTPTRAEKACAYDLDDNDIAWLEIFNGERAKVCDICCIYIVLISYIFHWFKKYNYI